MPPRTTRSVKTKKLAGTPQQLSEVDLATYRDCIRHYYYLRDLHPNRNYLRKDIIRVVTEDIIKVWKRVNSSLPLQSTNSVFIKVTRILDTAEAISRRQKSHSVRKNLLFQKLDKLMDISACTCPLSSVNCSDSRVNCRTENCGIDHVLCTCPPSSQERF